MFWATWVLWRASYGRCKGISISIYVSMQPLTWSCIFMMFGHVGLRLLNCDVCVEVSWFFVGAKIPSCQYVLPIVIFRPVIKFIWFLTVFIYLCRYVLMEIADMGRWIRGLMLVDCALVLNVLLTLSDLCICGFDLWIVFLVGICFEFPMNLVWLD